MNMKGILAVGLVLIFVLMASASAADNATIENSTQSDAIAKSGDITDDINVTFDEKMWQENLSDISVELPDGASGEFCIKLNNEAIYNETITDHSFKVPIKLPKPDNALVINIYPPLDFKAYKVSAFYNGIDLNLNRSLKVMANPPDYENIRFPEEILQNMDRQVILIFPRSANGIVEFYIDDELIERTNTRPLFTWENDPFSNRELGNHTARISYLGDDYYRPFNRSFNFTVTNVKISIPKVINIGHDDCIAVEASTTASATVKVFLDDRLIANSKMYNGEFIMSLEKYIRYTDREIKVVFEGRNLSRTKTQSLNMTYDFDVWPLTFTYGDKNTFEVMLPDTLNNNLLTIEINGTRYPFKRSENIVNNQVEVDVSNLGSGNYTMTVSFAGDDKFYALKRTYEFTINYGFHVPYEVEYMDSSKVFLELPEDACGSLMVYVNGNLYRTVGLANGYAEVKIDSLAPGDYNLLLSYSGDDYDIEDVEASFTLVPKISVTYRFTAGEDGYVMVEVPKDCRGHVIFNIDDKPYKVIITEGIARYSLKNLAVGEHDIYIDYYGASGFEDLDQWRVVTVYKAKIKPVSSEVTFKGVNVKMKLLTKQGKPLISKVVTVKFNGKTYKVRTDKNGVLKFKKSMKLKKKRYTLTVTYKGSKLTKKFRVKPISIKASRTKNRLIVKATINKKVKNEVVKIKVDSKVYKVKTNKKGIAKLSVKKPKKIRSVKATYKGSTVTL